MRACACCMRARASLYSSDMPASERAGPAPAASERAAAEESEVSDDDDDEDAEPSAEREADDDDGTRPPGAALLDERILDQKGLGAGGAWGAACAGAPPGTGSERGVASIRGHRLVGCALG